MSEANEYIRPIVKSIGAESCISTFNSNVATSVITSVAGAVAGAVAASKIGV